MVLYTCKGPLFHSSGVAVPVLHVEEFQVDETAKIKIFQLKLSKPVQSEKKDCALSVFHNQSTSSPNEDLQYAVETSRSSSQVTMS